MVTKFIFIQFISLYLCFTFFSESTYAKEFKFLSIPNQTAIPIGNNDKIWIENKKVLAATDKGNSLILQAKALGTCDINVGNKNYSIIVTSPTEFKQYKKIISTLRFLPHLNLGYENSKFIIEGKITDISEWLTLANLGNTNWLLRAEVLTKILDNVEELLNLELTKLHFQNIKIENLPFPTVKLPKELSDKNNSSLTLFKKYGLTIEKDDDILNIEPLIKVNLTLTEVRKSELQNYGIKLPNEYSSSIIDNFSIKNASWNEPTKLELLEKNGTGKILATPVLLSKSGSESTFLAGGEIPIKLVTSHTHEVIWKKYGIQLKVKPQADSLGHIKMYIEAEVSSLDRTQSVDGIPALITNSVQSYFDLQKSQTLVLSGLVKHVDDKTIQGWPGLIHLPILGELFSSSDYQKNKTEMIVFVTPEIVRN